MTGITKKGTTKMAAEIHQTPRDFRDEIDLDNALDSLRTMPRDKAREFYLICLQCAHAQGRCEVASEMFEKHKRIAASKT